jgi:hypothetical protein
LFFHKTDFDLFVKQACFISAVLLESIIRLVYKCSDSKIGMMGRPEQENVFLIIHRQFFFKKILFYAA